MSGDAKQRLARLLGELDRSAETPAGEFDPDDADYPLSETSSIELTESDAEDARARRAEKLPGGVMAGRLESKVQARTAKLEERLAVLMEENAKKDAATAEALAKQAKSFGEERAKMMEAVQLLKDKQSELERLAPPLREAVQGAKDQLRSVVCSQERLKELQAQDPSALSLADFVILRVHQETANLRADLDVTRVERDTSRDALGRLELDNKRLAREAKRASEYISQSDKEGEAERAALDSRCDRLTRELEDAMVKVEVLSAKGAMYDEVASTVDRLGKRCAEAEKDLAVAKGQEQLLREERDGLASKLASRQHQVDLLSQDKAYLTREVDALADRERKREEEEDRLREKARALRVSRDALQEKVLSGNAEFRSQHEERLNAEVARLQQKAAEDLERLREEHASARDREIRALRDLRDAAVADSVAARAELNDLRGAYDDLLAQHRASQTRADVARAEITGQLRMKAMELERVSMLHGESQSVAKVLRLECETLTKKVRLLESQYLGLEASAARRRAEADARSAEQAARLEHYESLERELDDAVMLAAGAIDDAGAAAGEDHPNPATGSPSKNNNPLLRSADSVASALGALGASVPASLRRRLAQNVALGRRCHELERLLRAANAERDQATQKAETLEGSLRRANSKAHDATQPYNYLVERIAKTEEAADEAGRAEREATRRLGDAEARANRAREEADALRQDLKRALDERQELAKIKAVLANAPRAGAPRSTGKGGAEAAKTPGGRKGVRA